MAREYARLQVSIYGDGEFRALSRPAQHLYLMLLISPKLDSAGVTDWRPNRIAPLTHGATVDEVLAAAEELCERRYLLIDEETEEVMIRSFVRNDGLMSVPNMAVSMSKAYRGIASSLLRECLVYELRRLHADSPELNGWSRVKHLLDEPSADGPVTTSVNPSGKGSVNPSGTGKPKGSVNSMPTPAPSPAPSPTSISPQKSAVATSDDAAEFDKFWTVYPRKVGKGQARKAWKSATKKVDADSIVEAAREFANLSTHKDAEFIPHPSTWLNGERWADEERSGPASHTSRLPTPDELDAPPDGLSPDELTAWYAERKRRRA